MRYDLNEISIEQKKLDEYIRDQKGLEEEDTLKPRIMALIVELAETNNEIREFKFWSNKGKSDKEIIIDEYIDCIHFLVSIGNTLGRDNFIIEMKDEIKMSIDDVINDAIHKATNLYLDSTTMNYFLLFSSVLRIGLVLNFNMDDLNKSYSRKNRVNYFRQKENY